MELLYGHRRFQWEVVLRPQKGRINSVLLPSSVIILVPISLGNLINCVTSSVSTLLTDMSLFTTEQLPKWEQWYLYLKKSPFPIPLEMMPWSSQRAELLLSLAQDFLLPDNLQGVGLGHEQCENVCAVCPAHPAATEVSKKSSTPLDHRKLRVRLLRHFHRIP